MKNQEKSVKSNNANLLDKLKKSMNLGNQEISISANGEIYNYPENKQTDLSKKNFRTNIRKQLDTYYSLIVLSGNKNPNLIKDLEDFKKDYFLFWKVNDFKIESFTNCREAKKPKMIKLINALKQYVELSK